MMFKKIIKIVLILLFCYATTKASEEIVDGFELVSAESYLQKDPLKYNAVVTSTKQLSEEKKPWGECAKVQNFFELLFSEKESKKSFEKEQPHERRRVERASEKTLCCFCLVVAIEKIVTCGMC